MKKVNIIFDDVLEDVDIIAVPDEVEAVIESLGQEFLNWIPETDDSDYWTIINGKKCNIAETDGFIKWLNSTYCFKKEKAYVLERNTIYCDQYKIIEF